MELPFTICYISVGDNVTEEDVNEIFSATDHHNNNCNIGGILLYSKEINRFFQVLEGEEEEVKDLYHEKILGDKRHKHVVEIFHKPTSEPIFFNYASKFNLVKSGQDLKKVKNYVEEHKYSRDNSEEVLRLLEPFLIFYS